jgi:hypothetical protein
MHDATDTQLIERRIAATREEIRLRKQSINEIKQCLALITRHGDVKREPSPTPQRCVSARLFPGTSGPVSKPGHQEKVVSAREPLTHDNVVALGRRLCPTNTAPITDPPPLVRTVVTASHFRRQRKHQTSSSPVPEAGGATPHFTDQSAQRLARDDPARRRQAQQRRVDAANAEAKKLCTTRARAASIENVFQRSYDAASRYAEQRQRADESCIKHITETALRTCVQRMDELKATELVSRLGQSESDDARKRRERVEREYADDFLPCGTANNRRHAKSPLSSQFRNRLFSELSKGYAFEWRHQ